MEAFQRAATLALQLEVPTASMTASNSDPTAGEECWKTDVEVAGARSLHPMVAKIQLEALAAMWKVDQLWEILTTTSRVLDYYKNPITTKIESC
jgi:hypothetical protein